MWYQTLNTKCETVPYSRKSSFCSYIIQWLHAIFILFGVKSFHVYTSLLQKQASHFSLTSLYPLNIFTYAPPCQCLSWLDLTSSMTQILFENINITLDSIKNIHDYIMVVNTCKGSSLTFIISSKLNNW